MTRTTATRERKNEISWLSTLFGTAKAQMVFSFFPFPSTTQRRNVLRCISRNMQRRRFNCKPFYTQFVRVTANSQPLCIWHLFTVEVLPSSLQPMMMRSYLAHNERKEGRVWCHAISIKRIYFWFRVHSLRSHHLYCIYHGRRAWFQHSIRTSNKHILIA